MVSGEIWQADGTANLICTVRTAAAPAQTWATPTDSPYCSTETIRCAGPAVWPKLVASIQQAATLRRKNRAGGSRQRRGHSGQCAWGHVRPREHSKSVGLWKALEAKPKMRMILPRSMQ